MSADETTLEADGLRVAFFRRGDRYAHRVDVFDAATGAWSSALESLEGRDDEQWPPSPPFQQLHVERRPSGPIIFLIGMAGKSHWSAAVEVAADRKSMVFDVAIRYQAWPEYLGSAYSCQFEFGGKWPKVSVYESEVLEISNEISDGPLIRPCGEFSNPPATLGWKYVISGESVEP